MATSKYERSIVRKPGVISEDGEFVVPEKLTVKRPHAGPIRWWSPEMGKQAKQVIEVGMITADTAVGTGRAGSFQPYKTSRGGEYFMFLGTDPDDPMDLGAEAEFWLGEGEDLEKLEIKTSVCVYIPPGLGHFPIIWKNVRRRVMYVVLVPEGYVGCQKEPVSLEGRPT